MPAPAVSRNVTTRRLAKIRYSARAIRIFWMSLVPS